MAELSEPEPEPEPEREPEPEPEPEPQPQPQSPQPAAEEDSLARAQALLSGGAVDPLAAYRRMHEPRRRGDATRRAPTPEEDEEEQQEPPPRTPTVDLLQNRPYLMTEDWGGPAVQPLAGLGRAEELNNCFAVAEEDRTRMVREAQGRMFPARRRVLELHTPPKQAAEKRAESWSLGPGWGEGKLGREGLQQRRVDWETAKFPNFSTMGRDVRRKQRQSIELQTNNPIKIRQKPKDPTAGRRLPTHLKTTKRCPTPDGMVGRTTRLLRAVGSSSVGMTADQMERRRQGQKERLAIRERRRNPGPPWERDAPPEDMAPRSHGIARTCA
jgi:hypothetical protein